MHAYTHTDRQTHIQQPFHTRTTIENFDLRHSGWRAVAVVIAVVVLLVIVVLVIVVVGVRVVVVVVVSISRSSHQR